MNIVQNILRYSGIALAFALISCSKELPDTVDDGAILFKATSGGQDTRTYLSSNSVLWAEDDVIVVNGTSVDLKEGIGTATGFFLGSVRPYGTNSFYAGHPESLTKFSNGKLSVGIPAVQTYNPANVLLGQMPMAAYTEGYGLEMALDFKNAANILRLKLKGDGKKSSAVLKIVVSTTAAMGLSGDIPVTVSGSELVFGDITATSSNKTITLNCGSGVYLDPTTETVFDIVVPKIPSSLSSATLDIDIMSYLGRTISLSFNAIKTQVPQFYTVNNINTTSYTVPSSTMQEGILPGRFTVSAGTDGSYGTSDDVVVNFSQGNLQYQASTKTWRFAENQNEYVGDATYGNVFVGSAKCNNASISSSYSGWIDLFGWGTSGYGSYYPYLNSTSNSSYYDGGHLAGTNYDWGVYNPISNGGNTAGIWRTLSRVEWDYLIATRTVTVSGSSKNSYGMGTVGGVPGMIILPDNWNGSVCSSFTYGSSAFTANTFTADTWVPLENAGAVFLPAAGRRSGTSLNSVTSEGSYWSTTRDDSNDGQRMYFSSGSRGSGYSNKQYGYSVRLVHQL